MTENDLKHICQKFFKNSKFILRFPLKDFKEKSYYPWRQCKGRKTNSNSIGRYESLIDKNIGCVINHTGGLFYFLRQKIVLDSGHGR